MYLIMLILDQPNKLIEVLDAWDAVGICGATILESTGVFKLRTRQLNLPARYAFPLSEITEQGNYTIISIVPDEPMIQRCLEATEQIIGDLNQPKTGIFAAWPLSLCKGLSKEYLKGDKS
ncbi:MAG: hypothetical protein WHV66_02645 [Anaerolineales bacterium]